MATPTTFKTARVIKEYPIKYKGFDLVIPVGAKVSNQTAGGCDDAYRFWTDFHHQAAVAAGVQRSLLAHDLTYYGINVPADHCSAYIS